MNNNKIAVLLPYKDHFTNSHAGSASIWVKDFNKSSEYNNQLTIFGNTPYLDDLIDKKNYKNLVLKKISLGSKNTLYVNEFINHQLFHKFKLVEIHNRPSYVHQIIKNKNKIKIVLIFHNNPITLGGSKTLVERRNLLESCDKLIFVSNWVREKFFEGFDKKNHHKCIVIYPSINPIKRLPRKNNIISFVGKLNRSKGFHIFGKSIIKILKYGKYLSKSCNLNLP